MIARQDQFHDAARQSQQKADEKDAHRAVPHSPDAEKGVLSSMLQAPNELISEAQLQVRPDQFYHEGRRILFTTMLELQDKGTPVDLIALNTVLIDRNQLDFVGGPGEIAEIMSFAPSAAHFAYYAGILRDKATLREMAQTCFTNYTRCYGDVESVTALVDSIETDILAVRERDLPQKSQGFGSHLETMRLEIQEAFERFTRGDRRPLGLVTGLIDLDAMLGGLQPEELIIIAARPSMGKTSLMLTMLDQIAVTDREPAGVISLEMSGSQLIKRLTTMRSMIEYNHLTQGNLSAKRDFPRLEAAIEALAQSKIHIEDTPALTVEQIRARARRWKQRHGMKALFIDYLGLVKSSYRAERRQLEVAHMTSGLKALAKELHVPVVVLVQLNRDGANGRPKLEHLREAGDIEQDADVVGLLWEPNPTEQVDCNGAPVEASDEIREITLTIAKQRNGATGDIPLHFLKRYMQYRTASPSI